MFRNLEELKEEIRAGKTNEQIIQERLQYLKSDEYKKTRQPVVRRPGTNEVMFHDGYIQEDEEIAFSGDSVDVLYRMDEISIFNKLIDLVRANMDKEGFNMPFLIKTVILYFDSEQPQSKYYEMAKYITDRVKSKSVLRNVIPEIIYQYINSSYKGSILDFGKGLLRHYYGFGKKYPEFDELRKKYLESVDFEKIQADFDVRLPISAIKGLGIAACTERAMMVQNCLAFLGYDSYMLGGQLTTSEKSERHNFNIIRIPNSDKFAIVDAAQLIPVHIIEGIHSIEEIRSMKNIKATTRTKTPIEVVYDVDDIVAIKKDEKEDDYDDR